MDERKTILQRMDDLVRWTGIPAATQRPPRRRPLRWVSVLAVVSAVGGFVAGVATHFTGTASWIGYALVMASFVVGTLLQAFGPLKPFGSALERTDEFDRALRQRAYLFAFPGFALATILGLMLLMFMLLAQWPRAAVMLCLSELMMLLLALATLLPAVYAGWSVEWHKDEG